MRVKSYELRAVCYELRITSWNLKKHELKA